MGLSWRWGGVEEKQGGKGWSSIASDERHSRWDLRGFCLFGNTHTYTQMKIKTVYPHSWKQHKKQSYEKAAGLEAAELMADACITKGHKKDSNSSLWLIRIRLHHFAIGRWSHIHPMSWVTVPLKHIHKQGSTPALLARPPQSSLAIAAFVKLNWTF